jgi:outer membrane protein assembly factor BamA
LALLLASAWPAGAAVAQAPIDSMEIASVAFPGAHAFPGRLLATTVVTAQTQCIAVKPLCWLGIALDRRYLDAITLEQDAIRLRIFYAQQGYRETKVTPDTVRDGERVRVSFHIVEGEPIVVDTIAVVSADSIPPDVRRGLPLAVRAPLSLPLLEATRDTLIQRLKNRGYARAEVLANADIPAGQHLASVRYDVYPDARSRFGAIDIVGEENVSESVIRRMLTFQPGDVFTQRALLDSQRNLFAQAVFRHAEVRDLPDSATVDTLIPVRVQVNEGNLHHMRGGVGLSSAEYLNGEVRWSSRSFQGGARRLELRGTVTNLFAGQLEGLPGFDPTDAFYGDLSGTLNADFTQPWFFGPLNSFGAGLGLERQSIPGVFVRESGGGYLTFSRTLGAAGLLTAGYRPERTRLSNPTGDAIFCLGFTACDSTAIRALSRFNWLAPLSLTVTKDRSNSLFAPTRGYAVRLDAEVAARETGSQFGYVRLAVDLTDYHTITPGIVWALRVKPGVAWSLTGSSASSLGVHPQKRFFAGGPNSVRGFAQYELGPKLLTIDAVNRLMLPADSGGAGCDLTQINDGSCDARALAGDEPRRFRPRPVGGAVSFVANAEIRFPLLGDQLRGATFIDVGQVWESHENVNLADLAWTPGFGVRYFSPIGPIRVDIGYYAGRGETLTVVTHKVGTREDGHCSATPPGPTTPTLAYCDIAEQLQVLDQPVFWNRRRSFFDRLQFHFSIGQAF